MVFVYVKVEIGAIVIVHKENQRKGIWCQIRNLYPTCTNPNPNSNLLMLSYP